MSPDNLDPEIRIVRCVEIQGNEYVVVAARLTRQQYTEVAELLRAHKSVTNNDSKVISIHVVDEVGSTEIMK